MSEHPTPTNRRAPLWRCLYVAALAVLSLPWASAGPARAQGAGDLVVAPTRVVFEGRDRSARLSLVNRGSATATYRITVVNMAMSDNGELTPVEKPDDTAQTAERLFRYAPRQVVLTPGSSQAIRLLLRKPADLQPGEYRSHLMMRAVPADSAGQSVEQPSAESGVRIRLIPVYGVTIPVIVRHGDMEGRVTVSDVVLTAGEGGSAPPRLAFRLNRTGARSAFGDVQVTYVPDGGSELVLASASRLAVYTPNDHRNIELTLRLPDGVALERGRLRVAYRTPAERAGATPLAEAEIRVP